MNTAIKNLKKLALLLMLVFGISALVSAQSKTPVKITDLQKNIIDKIAKDYAGYTIKDAWKTDKNKVITYDVNIIKHTKTLCLAFDNSGKFLKAMDSKSKSTTSNSSTSMNTKNNSKTQQK